MNYLNKTENLLKSCLKGKRKITTGTVVAFLIMGISAFAFNNDHGYNVSFNDANEVEITSEILGDKSYIKADGTNKENTKVIIKEFDKEITSGKINNENYAFLITTNTNLENNANLKITAAPNYENKDSFIKFNVEKGRTYSLVNNGNLTAIKNIKDDKTYTMDYGMEVNSTNKDAEISVENNGAISGDISGTGIKISGPAKKLTINNNGDIKLSNGNVAVQNGIEISNANNQVFENLNITNNAEISVEGRGISVQNLGKNTVIANGKNGKISSSTGIEIAKQNYMTDVEIINEGEITSKMHGINVVKNNGTLKIKNSNKIETTATNFDARAISIDNIGIVDIENTGDIIAKRTGIYIAASPSSSNTIKNSGLISVSGNSAKGILISGANMANNKTNIINEESGMIEVSGTSSGAEGQGRVTGVDINIGSFENKGTIKLGEGTQNGVGIDVSSSGTAINKGTIEIAIKGTGNIAMTSEKENQAVNAGFIKVTDGGLDGVTSEEEMNKILFGENSKVENAGMVVDENNNAIFIAETITEDTTTTVIDRMADEKNGSVSINAENGIKITGTETAVTAKVVNLGNGSATIEGDAVFEAEQILLDASGKFVVDGVGNVLTLKNGALTKQENTEAKDKTAVQINNDGTLNLDNMEFNGDILGEKFKSNLNISGNSSINGNIDKVVKILVDNGETYLQGKVTEFGSLTIGEKNSGKLILSQNSSLEGDFVEIKDEGQIVLELGKNGENALQNSKVTIQGTDKNSSEIMLKTENISGKEITIDLGYNIDYGVDAVTDSQIYIADKINNSDTDKDTVTIKYNEHLYGDNDILDNVNAHAYGVSNYFSSDKTTRKMQQDKLYSSNIYSETVKAAYDNTKLVEDSILSLDTDTVAGKWTANGKALYSKNEYDRTGTLGDYSSDIESTGLLASLEYGLNDTTSVGFAFAGVKQDLDSDGGSADGDVFYFGAFGNKEMGSYKLTAGLGYQLGKYEADNNAASISSNDKYDSNAFSAYVQGKRIVKVEEGLTFEPKLKLGYTYIDQDDVKDDYFRLKDAELSTFNAEFGFDVVKTVQFDKSKLDVVFGASYVRAMGDTDNKFTGSFAGDNGTFDILGAELDENTVKFNLTGEVMNENGFFYNGGFTYRFGGEDTKDYGVNVGVGYNF